jgi:hypothetical protein
MIKGRPPQRLLGGVVVCSNDGNVMVPWPTEGASPTLGQQVVYVGQSRFAPAFPTVRSDQSSSSYTFKVLAYVAADGEVARLHTLEIDATVQDEIVEVLSRGGLSRQGAPPPVGSRWHTWDLPVRVRRKVS